MSSPPTTPAGASARAPGRFPLYARVLLGVAAGAALGIAFGKGPIVLGLTNESLGQLGLLVIRLLKALAAPLILLAILDAFLKVEISRRDGLRLMGICLVNVSVAFGIGLLILNTFHPGERWRGRLEEIAGVVGDSAAAPRAPNAAASGIAASVNPTLDPLRNVSGYVPESLVDPFLKNNVISIVLFAILLGVALRHVRDERRRLGLPGPAELAALVETVYEVTLRMLLLVVETIPFAVLGVVAQVVGRSGLAVFSALWVFLATILAGLCLHALVYYPLVAYVVGRRSPRAYLGGGADAIVTGLSCNSSLATVPVTLSCLSRMGVSEGSARLSACIGTNLNNDGITLYEAMAALFLAQAYGFDLDPSAQLVVVLASLMAGIGVAGVPEAGLIVLPLVLGAAGLPDVLVAAAIPTIIPVDWILARCRSGVNVMSDMLVAILLDSRLLGGRGASAPAGGDGSS